MAQGGVHTDERTDAELVQAARSTEPEAFGQLFDRWFDRSWNVARNIVRQDDIAAEVAQDAMLNAWQRLDQLRDVEAFGGWLLRITRNRALNRLERERRSRAAGDEVVSGVRDRRLQLGHTDPTGAQSPPSTDAAVDIRDKQELVWAAAAALGERDASLLDLHLRHGLAPAEIAEELGVEANTAHQQLFRMRTKLGDAIGSYVLWRNGRPLCEGLAAAVSGQVAFDRSVSKAVAKHQKNCDQCSERRAALLDPSKLFASVPLIGVPLHLKVDAAAALQNAGVPVDAGSISAGGRSFDPPDGPPSEPPQADGPGSMPEPTSSSPTPQPAGQPVLADATSAYSSGSTGFTGPTLPPTVQFSRTPPSKSLPTTALPSRAALAKMAIIGSATMLVGLIVLALWQAGVFGLFGGDEVAAEGSEIVAGPTISSNTSDTETTSTEQAGLTETEANPPAGVDSTDGDSPDGGATDGNGLIGIADDPTTTSSNTTGSISATSRSADPTTTVDDGTATESTTETTPTTETTTTTITTTSTESPTSQTETTESTTTTTEPTTTQSTQVTTTEPPDPPVILRFTSRVSSRQLECDYRTQRTYDAIWAADNTSSVQLSLPNGTTHAGKSKGAVSFCGAPGQTIILVASGPGGEDKATTTLDN